VPQRLERPPVSDAALDAAAETTAADALAALSRWRRAVDAEGAPLLDARSDASGPNDPAAP
jgi:hypothetical protein